MGSDDSKIGITSNPIIRLGVYQNSYSHKSHIACFDTVYVGPKLAIAALEKAVKIQFNWQIEREGRGFTEWISKSHQEIETKIDEIILGYRFHIKKLPNDYTPLTVDNYAQILTWIDQNYA